MRLYPLSACTGNTERFRIEEAVSPYLLKGPPEDRLVRLVWENPGWERAVTVEGPVLGPSDSEGEGTRASPCAPCALSQLRVQSLTGFVSKYVLVVLTITSLWIVVSARSSWTAFGSWETIVWRVQERTHFNRTNTHPLRQPSDLGPCPQFRGNHVPG